MVLIYKVVCLVLSGFVYGFDYFVIDSVVLILL